MGGIEIGTSHFFSKKQILIVHHTHVYQQPHAPTYIKAVNQGLGTELHRFEDRGHFQSYEFPELKAVVAAKVAEAVRGR